MKSRYVPSKTLVYTYNILYSLSTPPTTTTDRHTSHTAQFLPLVSWCVSSIIIMIRNFFEPIFYVLFCILIKEQCCALVSFSSRCHSLPGAVHVDALRVHEYRTSRFAAQSAGDDGPSEIPTAGKLEELKRQEAKLSSMLASVRRQKLAVLRGMYRARILIVHSIEQASTLT